MSADLTSSYNVAMDGVYGLSLLVESSSLFSETGRHYEIIAIKLRKQSEVNSSNQRLHRLQHHQTNSLRNRASPALVSRLDGNE